MQNKTQLMHKYTNTHIFSTSWVHFMKAKWKKDGFYVLRIYEYETAGIGSWCNIENDHK